MTDTGQCSTCNFYIASICRNIKSKYHDKQIKNPKEGCPEWEKKIRTFGDWMQKDLEKFRKEQSRSLQ